MLERIPITSLLSCLIGLLIVSCLNPEYSSETSYTLINRNELSIGFDKQIRLQGLSPIINNCIDPSAYIIIKKMAGGDPGYLFKNSHARQSVELIIKQYRESNVVGIYLKTNSDVLSERIQSGLLIDSVPGLTEGIALHRAQPVKAWTIPVHFSVFSELDSVDNQFLYWKYQDNTYAIILPLGGNGAINNLGQWKGKLKINTSLGTDYETSSDTIPLFSIAFGKDFYKTLENLYKVSVDMMGITENLRTEKKFPAIFEKLGWCSWNAYMHDVDEEKILRAARSFQDKNISLGYMLIDDGWLMTEDNKLMALSPDTVKFPRGFRPMVNQLHQKYNIPDVGVWHTLNGYWEGINEHSVLYEEYEERMYRYCDRIVWLRDSFSTFMLPSPVTGALAEFYDEWYNYLKKEGISLVKVDNQNVINQLAGNGLPLWDAGSISENNLQTAIEKHFDGAVLNCMDMSSNTLYHFGKSAVARAVEDYYPADNNMNYSLQYTCNAAGHIQMSLFNSIWFSGFVYPDFDMFQSHRNDAEYHAIARAISGGPIYLTDLPGHQNVEIIRKMILDDGTILRTDQPAMPTEDCLFSLGREEPFKAFSKEGNSGLLAVWNVSDTEKVCGTFSPADIVGLKGDSFTVYDHFSGKLKILDYDDKDTVELGRMAQKLYIIVPIVNDLAPIGLLEKYNAPASILSQENRNDSIVIRICQGGVFGIYCRKKPVSILVNKQEIEAGKLDWDKGLLSIVAGDSKLPVEIIIAKNLK